MNKQFEASEASALVNNYDDIWLVAGQRTPFVDYNGVLRDVSPTDLGIFAARALFEKSGVPASEVGGTVAGNMAQASFDAYFLPRHIGLYSGVNPNAPAVLVQRLCGTGFETILTAADQIKLGKAKVMLCVGTESMSRNPVSSYTHRAGFRMGQVEFKDFLWEATKDPVFGGGMGDTAENLAKMYGIGREEVDRFAEQSFARAAAAWDAGYFSDEVSTVVNSKWELEGYQPRGLKLADRAQHCERDGHVRPTSFETLQKLRPAFGGVQTGGNSSAIVDGAAAVIVAHGDWVRANGIKPLARIVAGAAVAVPPEIMGIGPAPAIRAAAKSAGITVGDLGRIEINEAFGAQYLACERELGLDRDKSNVHGGAIAIGHPLGASGVRLTTTVARELKEAGLQFGVSSACAGGGQGVAIVVENAN
ncbi:MAG: acetyl-CoA C-acyltransferase [Betaproteobacteria bacterium HGW-Betaproteobacteria-13]|jgi:acetyl-CoA C-acetyltransferase|uniref:Acetyl-CoA acetyltransferase n=1 Tax=Parazoarcus communis TaxID=41977 RepID=A0A2U8H7B4_9RHOO|nr:thiolase family protein [Parazoarcus communis]AWI81450.1 acetyl-CoA acetyltransferase [Parazoarcus communis]PKO60010.1 MAG: acetyl-CoA C-acyltransferase [Betaproteobacteria bacterium HGW-Betaproteobacteria-19]PKO82652.1 MAG: acetyl-CoA C-acyltransferase [Betaproteobacteria bacterium HGW-Betaproteobacteria-13]